MSGISDELRQEGFQLGQLSSLRSLVKSTGWSLEKALTTLEIPQDKWKNYAELMNNQPASKISGNHSVGEPF